MRKKTLEQIALDRALKAVRRAYTASNNFEHGDLASFECLALVEKALADEFGQQSSKPIALREKGESRE